MKQLGRGVAQAGGAKAGGAEAAHLGSRRSKTSEANFGAAVAVCDGYE